MMNNIQYHIVCLGGGREVGRSCFIIKIDQYRIMCDCGIKVTGKTLTDRYPLFNLYQFQTQPLDAIFISHFHLDHSGGLPFLFKNYLKMTSKKCPIYMSHPSAIFLRAKINEQFPEDFTEEKEMIYSSIVCINQNEVINISPHLSIQAFIAGHVVGAIMFLIQYNNLKILYTGDYTNESDIDTRPLSIPVLSPNLIISECTNVSSSNEYPILVKKEFLSLIIKSLKNGGHVLLPLFSLGRVQEICMYLIEHWIIYDYSYPIYNACGLSNQLLQQYYTYRNYLNQNISSNIIEQYHHYISEFPGLNNLPNGPYIVLSPPAMLQGGLSLNLFKKLANDQRNLILFTGFVANHSIGSQLINGTKTLIIDKETINVSCHINQIKFSNHIDLYGLVRLFQYLQPKHICFVHGTPSKNLSKIMDYLNIKTDFPASGETLTLSFNQSLMFQSYSLPFMIPSHLNLSLDNVESFFDYLHDLFPFLIFQKFFKKPKIMSHSYYSYRFRNISISIHSPKTNISQIAKHTEPCDCILPFSRDWHGIISWNNININDDIIVQKIIEMLHNK